MVCSASNMCSMRNEEEEEEEDGECGGQGEACCAGALYLLLLSYRSSTHVRDAGCVCVCVAY